MATSPSRRSCAGPHDQLGRDVDREVDVVTAQQAEQQLGGQPALQLDGLANRRQVGERGERVVAMPTIDTSSRTRRFTVLVLPQIKLMALFGLDNPLGVAILHIMFGLAFNSLMYAAFIRNLPVELEESASWIIGGIMRGAIK